MIAPLKSIRTSRTDDVRPTKDWKNSSIVAQSKYDKQGIDPTIVLALFQTFKEQVREASKHRIFKQMRPFTNDDIE